MIFIHFDLFFISVVDKGLNDNVNTDDCIEMVSEQEKSHKGFNDNIDTVDGIEMASSQENSQCPRIAMFNGALITIFQKEMTHMSKLDPEDLSLIIQSYEQHHNLNCTEIFFEHLQKCDNIKMVEGVVDCIKHWEYSHAHDKVEGKIL